MIPQARPNGSLFNPAYLQISPSKAPSPGISPTSLRHTPPRTRIAGGHTPNVLPRSCQDYSLILLRFLNPKHLGMRSMMVRTARTMRSMITCLSKTKKQVSCHPIIYHISVCRSFRILTVWCQLCSISAPMLWTGLWRPSVPWLTVTKFASVSFVTI